MKQIDREADRFVQKHGVEAAMKEVRRRDDRVIPWDLDGADALMGAIERADQAKQSSGAGSSQPATTSSSPGPSSPSGGNAMSIEEIKAAISNVEHRVSTAAGQITTVRTELDEATTQLAHISQGTNSSEIVTALGELRSLVDALDQAARRALGAGETAGTYASRL